MSNLVPVIKILFLLLFFGAETLLSFSKAQKIEQEITNAWVAYYLVDLERNEVLDELNSQKMMTPASILKLLTTATALELHGANKRSHTTFYQQGEVVNGTLQGNLIIKAGADATLGSAHFASTRPEVILQQCQQLLNQAGIYSLNGKIIVDLSIMPPPYQAAGRLIEDVANYYAAPPMPLTWRDNTFQLVLNSPPTPGEICSIVKVTPTLNKLKFNSYVESAANNKDSAYIFGSTLAPVWDIRGTIPMARREFTIKGALPNPEMVFVQELSAYIDESSSYTIQMVYQPPSYSLAVELFTLQSPPLADVVKVVNETSNNLFADHVFLSLNNTTLNPANRWSGAAQRIKEFWVQKNIAADFLIFDGSGLSPQNRVTPQFIAEVLKHMNHSSNATVFKNSLAVGGVSGTLQNILTNTAYKGRVVAKSGSMQGVLNYAGYLQSRSNRTIAFVVMINNHTEPTVKVRDQLEALFKNWVDKF